MTSPSSRSSPQRLLLQQSPPITLQQNEIEHVLFDGAINDILHLDETIPPFLISEDADDVDECITPSPIPPPLPLSGGKTPARVEKAHSFPKASDDDKIESSSSSPSYWRLAAIVAGISLFGGVVTVALVISGSVHLGSEDGAPECVPLPQTSSVSTATEKVIATSPSIAPFMTAKTIREVKRNVTALVPVPSLSTFSLPFLSSLPILTPTEPQLQPAVAFTSPTLPTEARQLQQQQHIEALSHISPTAAFSLFVSSLKHATGDMFRNFQMKIQGAFTGAKELLFRLFLVH